jgi:hypothetical protein
MVKGSLTLLYHHNYFTMKWARVKPPGLSESGNDLYIQQDDAGCYKDYAKEADIEKTFVHLSHQWVHHEFYFDFHKENHYIRFQKNYQIFCGGYLYFYDERVRNGAIDHVIYFKWSPFKKSNGPHTVTIYLKPGPLRKKAEEAAYKTRIPEQEADESMYQTGNGVKMEVLQQAKSVTAEARESSDQAIDPPPPPKPPPPSMQGD